MKRPVLLLWIVLTLSSLTLACPFCDPGDSDLFTDLSEAQAVVLVSKIDTRKYKVISSWRGEVKPGRIVVAAEPQSSLSKKGKLLLTTAGPPNLPYWSDAPRILDDTELIFAQEAMKVLAKPRAAQLDFAAKHLQSASSEIADAAYNILAAAPLAEVQARAQLVGRERLLAWCKNAKIAEEKKALYLLMCYRGLSSADLPWLDSELFSKSRSVSSPLLGPLTVAYISHGGAKAVAKVESIFYQKSHPASRVTIFNRALTLAYEQNNQDTLRQAIRSLFIRELDHPQRGPFVLAPLAIWKTTSVFDKVEKLGQANRNQTWVKVAVIRYFRTFNGAEAQSRLASLKKLDPDLVNRTTDGYRRADLGID